jgi:molybdopterin-guanine dinucleotide biosynthesis adapter protein
MKTVAIVGASGSGKTRLITGLIAELKRRGLRTCVLKHCAHGFALDTEGKDTWNFAEAGADGVAMLGPGEWAVRMKARDVPEPDLRALARRLFADADVVLVEGGKTARFKKIEVLRTGVSGALLTAGEELLAVVSDAPAPDSAPAPFFEPSQTFEICEFILSRGEDVMADITLEVDGREVNMNPFVQTIFENTIRGMVSSLSGVDPDPETIKVVIRRGKEEPAAK